MTEDEKSRIEAEVKRRKEVAEKKGLKDVGDLYLRKIKYYPDWIRSKRDAVPGIVTDARELGTERNANFWGEAVVTRKIQVTLSNRDYCISFKESPFETPDGDRHVNGTLELYHEEKKIFALGFFKSYGRYTDDHVWHVMDIEAFIDGDWTNDFLQLSELVKQDEEQQSRQWKSQLESKEIAKLKQDFGI